MRPGKTKARPIRAVCVPLLLVLAAAAACGDGGSEDDDTGSDLTTVHVGNLPIVGYAAVWLGIEEGIFEEEGIEVVLDNITDPSNGVANIQAGRLQFSILTAGALAVSLTEGVPLMAATPLYFASDDEWHGIYVAADSPIDEIADLSGTTMALNALANSTQAAVNISLADNGVDPDDVRPILIPQGEIASALLSGRVGSAQMPEPFITMHRDEIRPIIPDPFRVFGPNTLIALLVTSEDYAEENPEAVAAFQRAMARASELAESDEAATREAVAKYTEVPADVLAEMALPAYGARLDLESQVRQAQAMLDAGFMDSMPDLESVQIPNPALEP